MSQGMMKAMKKRRLGRSEIEVHPLCFGGNVFGWTVDEATSFRLLDAFVEAGFEFIDTADVYSRWVPGHQGGESETILGKWMKARGNRGKLIIASKVGMEMGPDRKGLSRGYIQRAVEDSLRRLQTDYIDLYQAHRDDPETPLEETLEAFSRLIEQGKARVIGASNYDAGRLENALEISRRARAGLPRYETLQPLYNLYDRAEFEKNLEPVCHEHGLGVIPYYSLASGFLTGKYRSRADAAKSARGPGIVERYLNERGSRVLAALDQVAEKLHSNPTRVALAWLISRPSVTAPIASATRMEQLQDLIEATRLELDTDSLRVLENSL